MSKITYKTMRYLGNTYVLISIESLTMRARIVNDSLVIGKVIIDSPMPPSNIEKCFAKFRGWLSVEKNYNELMATILENGWDSRLMNPRYENMMFTGTWRRGTANG